MASWTGPAPLPTSTGRCGALNPWPGTWCRMGGEVLKVLEAEPATEDVGAEPGVVVRDLVVACGSGALALRRVQRPGRSPMAADAFLRGTPVPAGTVLGSA